MEILSEIDEIDKVLLSTEIYGEYEFNVFVEKVRDMNKAAEIIIFTNKMRSLDINFLNSKNIYKIYENNEKAYNQYIKKVDIQKEINENDIKEEIKNFKEDINKLKEKAIIDLKKEKMQKENSNLNTVIFCVTGANGVGKSIFSIVLAKYLEEINKKVLLIESNFYNQTIKNIFGTKDKKENIINLSAKIDLFIIKKNFLNDNYNNIEIMKKIDHIKYENKYDYIFIDWCENNFEENSNILLKMSDKILFLIEPNLIGLKKSKEILEIYLNDLKIDSQKINIIFNKNSQYSIDKNILKNIFNDYKIVGNVNYDEKYNLYINTNTKYYLEKKEYEKIYKNLI